MQGKGEAAVWNDIKSATRVVAQVAALVAPSACLAPALPADKRVEYLLYVHKYLRGRRDQALS